MFRFHGKCQLRRCIRFVDRPAQPNGAEKSSTFLIMSNESGISRAAPAVDVSRKLWAVYHLRRRHLLLFRGREALIQHLPKNRFILARELTNYVVHDR